jgi:Flp pilus assembly protein TadG
MVEFAIVVPILLIVVAGIVDLGAMVWQSARLNGALEAGVLYAMKNVPQSGWTNSSAGVTTAVTGAGVSGVKVTSASCFYGCANGSLGIVKTAGVCGGASPPLTCSGAVTGDTYAPGMYVEIDASLTRISSFDMSKILSLGLPTTLTATARIRVQ